MKRSSIMSRGSLLQAEIGSQDLGACGQLLASRGTVFVDHGRADNKRVMHATVNVVLDRLHNSEKCDDLRHGKWHDGEQ